MSEGRDWIIREWEAVRAANTNLALQLLKDHANISLANMTIINAMIAGEWSCMTCAYVATCDIIKLSNELDEMPSPCAGWQPRKDDGE